MHTDRNYLKCDKWGSRKNIFNDEETTDGFIIFLYSIVNRIISTDQKIHEYTKGKITMNKLKWTETTILSDVKTNDDGGGSKQKGHICRFARE